MELNKNYLVSVIITTYNRDEFLEDAINSVVNQTYKNIEILVIDDGSSRKYAEAICNKFENCKYFYKVNGGISSARNFGTQNATGDFIAFLDDDDLFMPEKIEKQIAILTNNLDVDCVHSSAAIIDENGIVTGETIGAAVNKANSRSGYVFWNALGNWCIKSPTPLFRKKVFDKLQFDEQLVVGEDLDFYQRMFYFYKIYYINEPLSYYRDCNSISRLSKNEEKYIGIERRFFENFLKMGIKNPFTLYKIAVKLARTGIRNRNIFYKDDKVIISKWKIFLNPFYYLKNLNNLKN
jgi:glycosyltransferase involved in cell wall biosynthesis